MLQFWNFFLENRAFTYFAVFLTLLAGGYAIAVIPKESAPEITIPIAVVSTPFYGASAGDVETLVTDPIEQAVNNLSGVDSYDSVSRSGFSQVSVTFEQSEDIDERTNALKDAIDQIKVELPADGNEPRVNKVEFSAQPIFTVSLVSDVPFYVFQQIVDELEKQMLEISYVARVAYSGIPEREISVILDNRKLSQSNLDYNTVMRSLAGSNVTQSAGSITVNDIPYPLDVLGEIKEFDQLSQVPISRSGEATVLLSDVAQIYNGYKERDTITRVGYPGGQIANAVTLQVSKKSGGDITAIARKLQSILEQNKDDLLQGVDYVVTLDAGQDIRDDLFGLLRSGGQTVVLVLLILLLFVGLRESIIAALSIPLSFLMAFVGFLITGSTINFISLFALILAIGILVDAAIVVVEGVNSKVAQGMRRLDAARATVQEFGIPLIAGTMTTIAVFFPLLFLSGIIGQFIRGIPATVIMVLVASIVVSLAFVTVFCSNFLRNRNSVADTQEKIVDKLMNRLDVWYRSILHLLLHNAVVRRVFLSSIILAFVASFTLVSTGFVKVAFFEGGDLEYAYIDVELPAGTDMGATTRYLEQIEQLVLEQDYIASFVSTAGQTSAYNDEISNGDQYGNITLNIDSEKQSMGVGLIDGLRDRLAQQGYRDATVVAQGGGPPTGDAINVALSSENNDVLRKAALDTQQLLRQMSGPITIESTLSGNSAGFDIVVDRNEAYRYGVSIADIVSTIRGATDGFELFDINQFDEDVPVVLRNKLNYASKETIITKDISPQMIEQLVVTSARGQSVLLGSLVDIVLAQTDAEITHTDGDRVVTVTAGVEPDMNANEVRAEFETKLRDMLPGTVQYSFGGEAQEQNESFSEVFVALLAGIFLMFVVLIIQFGRWRQVFIVMSVIPFGLTGVLIGLGISGYALSFPAMLGFIALSGVIVNNSIILVSVYNQMRVEHPEWTIDTLVVEGAVSRLRPILLTSLTTIIGMTPLLYASELWAPIAYAIIFGLLFCVFVTLGMVPVLFRRFEGFSEGTWASVWSWMINVLLLAILPIALFVGIVMQGSRVSSGGLSLIIVGFVVSVVVAYVLTHMRKHT